jgi:CubicO group peptidase (beta-lactamase class C family)
MEELIRRIERATSESIFSGVLSIFKGDSAVLNRAYGYRDVKNRLPNTTDTLFGIASGTKLVTALAIGVLIDQGVVSLETSVGEIDRGYRGFIDDGATIRHLLSHTSGVYDYYDEEIEQDYDDFTVGIPWCDLETPSDYMPLFTGEAKFRPGERYSYSNGGYVLLGMVIERVTGQLYRDFVRDHVLKPAGMERSGFHAFNDLPPNTANGYLEDRRTTNIYQLPIRGGGDGGMYATTYDLRALWESLFAHEILSPGLTETYLSTQWTFDDRDGYGCGLYKRVDDSQFWIVGGDAGVGFHSRHLAREGLTINVLSNITNGDNRVVRTALASL